MVRTCLAKTEKNETVPLWNSLTGRNGCCQRSTISTRQPVPCCFWETERLVCRRSLNSAIGQCAMSRDFPLSVRARNLGFFPSQRERGHVFAVFFTPLSRGGNSGPHLFVGSRVSRTLSVALIRWSVISMQWFATPQDALKLGEVPVLVPWSGANICRNSDAYHDHAEKYPFGTILRLTSVPKLKVFHNMITQISYLSSEGDSYHPSCS